MPNAKEKPARALTLEVSVLVNVELNDVPDDVAEALIKKLQEKGSLATGDLPEDIYSQFEKALPQALDQAEDDAEIVDII